MPVYYDGTIGSLATTLDSGKLKRFRFIWVRETFIGNGATQLRDFVPDDFTATNPLRETNKNAVIASMQAGINAAIAAGDFTLVGHYGWMLWDFEAWPPNWKETLQGGGGTYSTGLTQSVYNGACQYIITAIIEWAKANILNFIHCWWMIPKRLTVPQGLAGPGGREESDAELSWALDLQDGIACWMYASFVVPTDRTHEEAKTWSQNSIQRCKNLNGKPVVAFTWHQTEGAGGTTLDIPTLAALMDGVLAARPVGWAVLSRFASEADRADRQLFLDNVNAVLPSARGGLKNAYHGPSGPRTLPVL